MSYRVDVDRPIGSGGYGELFLGRRSDTGEQVVVKYLRDAHLLDARRQFIREVRILEKRLPGVVPILFADTPAEKPYYVMPFYPGGAIVGWAGRLVEPQLLNIATRVAEALARLHAGATYHGDIKPHNLLLDQQGHCQVADPLGNGFGCTVLFAGNRGGTPGYWGPEVKAGTPISSASDVYSYGATLFHLATGEAPLDGQRLDVLVRQRSVPTSIADVVTACCHPVATERPSMVDAMRIVRGESWAAIKEERVRAVVGVIAVIAVGVLFFTAGD